MKQKVYGYFNKDGDILKSDAVLKMAIKSREQVSEESQVLDEADIYATGMEIRRPISAKQIALLFEKSNTHRRCCEIKATDICTNYILTQLNENAVDEQKERIEDFLKKLNSSLISELKKGEIDYHAIGECYFELIRDLKDPNSNIISLNHIPAKDVYFLVGKNIIVQMVGAKRTYFKKYGYGKDVDKQTGIEYEVGTLEEDRRANEFISFKTYNPNDTTYGLPYILNVLEAIAGDIYARKFNNGRFEHFGLPAGLISISGSYNIDEIEEEIDAAMQNFIENPQSVAVIHVPSVGAEGNVEVKFERIQEEQQEASFLDFIKINKQEICEAHSVPLYLLGNNSETGTLGGDNSENAVSIYKRNIVDKRQNEIEDFINMLIKDAFKEEKVDWYFEFEDIDNEDKGNKLERFSKIFNLGGATIRDLINNFGDEFGLKATNEKIMDYRLFANQIINGNGELLSSSGVDDEYLLDDTEEFNETVKCLKSIFRG